ncbi:MAG: glycosyltransferase [Patescibacteria group bacterium]
MKDTISLSVITQTKNRAQLLEKCLSSLREQLHWSDEIIIVDNNSKDNTQLIINKYKRILPIRAYKSGLSGYPYLYNFAISKCRNPLLVFFDDDCVATHNFISTIRKAYTKEQNFILQGKTLSLPRGNIFAEISEDHLSNWIQSNALGKNRLGVIDNRNVAIPMSIIREAGGFSPRMAVGSEDVELGMRFVRMGVPIVYDTGMVVYHHERTTLRSFLSQHYRIAKSHAVLDDRFSEGQNISIINRYTLVRHLQSTLKRQFMYLQKRRYRDAFFLPFIYLLLVITRIVGYASGKHE